MAPWEKRKNKVYCAVTNDKYKKKQDQIKAAVEYCLEHDVRVWKAISTNQFPLISDPKTINRILVKDYVI